jgi:hypothetical protein
VETTPQAARGKNTQARGILEIADVARQRANEQKNKLQKQTFWNNRIALNEWPMPLMKWNRILQK